MDTTASVSAVDQPRKIPKKETIIRELVRTWTLTIRIDGSFVDVVVTGSLTYCATWFILRSDKKTSTPKGLYAAWLGANSFFFSLYPKKKNKT